MSDTDLETNIIKDISNTDISNTKIDIKEEDVDISGVQFSVEDYLHEFPSGLFRHNHKVKGKKIPLNIDEAIINVKLGVVSPPFINHDFDMVDNITGTGDMMHKVSYEKVEKSLEDLYADPKEYYSSAMDILGSYIRGQKLIYMEAKYHCETNLNYLMLPAIFLSSLAAVANVGLDIYPWGPIAMSGLNAFISFLIELNTCF